ncbi:EAL domain-containing protein [Aliikangiella maris]|uniref:EAL domain-containing protein n=2 Tax=Aliikangiella maris TaxID=3162458 RepID=A0ABV3MQ06_9GAMM
MHSVECHKPKQLKTALVCQNDLTERELTCDMLRQYGMMALDAENAQQALNLIHQYNPDIILLDVDFHVSIKWLDNRNQTLSTAFEFCQYLSQQSVFKNIPVVMLAATQTINELRMAYQSGASELASKPINLPILLERLNHFLITQESNRKSKKQLNYLTQFDPLTGLINRSHLIEKIEYSLLNTLKINRISAVLVIDIDNFKRINNVHGHNFGDKILKVISKRLRKSICKKTSSIHNFSGINSSTELARLGGDEFTLFIDNIDSVSTVITLAKQQIESINAPIILNGEQVVMTASVGIAIYSNDKEEVYDLLRNAEKAMYAAKNNGGNTYRLYNEEMNASAKTQFRLENELRNAIEQQQLQLHYQPQIDAVSGKVVSLEALLRWHHPELGWIDPGVFISIAESCGLIISIGDWVLKNACEQARSWLEKDDSLERIAVNVSTYQFQQPDFFSKTLSILKEVNLPAHYLELELTESIIMSDAKENISKLKCFKDVGVSLAIDDFGTGYSSLSYLNNLPIDTLKIDRSFIANITKKNKECVIVGTILALAKQLNLKVIAEGVENLNQVNFLKHNFCTILQGFYYSRAIPAHEVDKMLALEKVQTNINYPANKVTMLNGYARTKLIKTLTD